MNWRLILDGAHPGAWNMAMDEALLLCHAANPNYNDGAATALPTLRFYSWQPACLSLGRFQKWDDVPANRTTQTDDMKAKRQAPHAPRPAPPFDIVRRPTGGRAVWHQHEITYCAVLREEFLPRDARSVAGAYRWLSQGFIAGLRTMGVEAALSAADHIPVTATEQVGIADAAHESAAKSGAESQVAAWPATSATHSTDGRPQPTPNCFASTTRADFVVQGRKLIGAAQMRRAGVVLQHGSLLLDVDEAAWQRAIGGSLRDVATLRSLGVTSALSHTPNGSDAHAAHNRAAARSRAARSRADVSAGIIAALCAGCERELGWSLQHSEPGPRELALAERLQAAKYAQTAWNIEAKEDASWHRAYAPPISD